MFKRVAEGPKDRCAAEAELAHEFPGLYAFFVEHPASRPQDDEIWTRVLRVARNSAPVLADLRERGLNLVRLDQYTPPGTDRRPLYQTVIDWLPRIQDPLTLTVCLGRLTEPGARALVRKNREVLLSLTRQWHERLREGDHEQTLSVLSQCLMKAVLERDIPEVLGWARDRLLPRGARANYVLDLQRFAKKPGRTRDALIELLTDSEVGSAAVWAIAGAAKADALALLRELRVSSPHEPVRTAAKAVVKKIEARSGQVTLPKASPTMLPQGYRSTSIEFDTDRFPELLSLLEREMKGQLKPGVTEQLVRSAAQIRRDRRRFHIVQIVFGDRSTSQLGFELYAEDEDVIVVGIHFGQEFQDAIGAGLNQFLDDASERRE